MIKVNLCDSTNTPTVAALGIFDGVHLGHRRVIQRAQEIAAQLGVAPAVFTFTTASVTSKGRLESIMTEECKTDTLASLGVKYIAQADFAELRDMTPEEFVKNVAVGCLNARCVVCGEDFRFGKGGRADVTELRRLCENYGVRTEAVGSLEIGGEAVSSTRIRELIKSGGISRAAALMGSRFGFRLPVEHGFERGRTWDFPTINQRLPDDLVKPRFGVYCSKVLVGENWLPAVTNIGVKPTVEDRSPPLAETYIIGWHGDLYGENLEVELYEFVRPEMKFKNVGELSAEIARNKGFAARYFGIS